MKASPAMLLAMLLTVSTAAVGQQPASAPLAVLVQPAEARSLAVQREFIGRAQALVRNRMGSVESRR